MAFQLAQRLLSPRESAAADYALAYMREHIDRYGDSEGRAYAAVFLNDGEVLIVRPADVGYRVTVSPSTLELF